MTYRITPAAFAVGAASLLGAAFVAPAGAAAQTADESVETAPEDDPANESLAAELTRRHQLKQSFTVKRTVNGEVVETSSETISLNRDRPTLPSEAGKTIEQRLKEAFDRRALTRPEAFEEGKLDFTIGDVDRDGRIDAAEFDRLLALLNSREPSAPGADSAGEETSIRASFVNELAPVDQRVSFASFSGPEGAPLDEKRFTLEFLKVFDAADTDADGVLQGEELTAFRQAFSG